VDFTCQAELGKPSRGSGSRNPAHRCNYAPDRGPSRTELEGSYFGAPVAVAACSARGVGASKKSTGYPSRARTRRLFVIGCRPHRSRNHETFAAVKMPDQG
jgi:hypothetical protein